ncbi:MAG: hypothetical protein ACJ8C4_09020 [Gemmataceae bacterium]
MGQKKHHRGPAPVPPGNQPSAPANDERGAADTTRGAGFEEQDPKRRLGDYTGAGEAAYVQPGGSNDANHETHRRTRKK